MTKKYDEPKYIDVKREDSQNKRQKEKSIKMIKSLCTNQSFGVLATQGDETSYSSLISFVTNDDYSKLVFATPIDTKKLDYISKHNGVSVLIDNRNDNPNNINDIVAVTVMGKAIILDEDKKDFWIELLVDKHEYLKKFTDAPSTAIVMVDISKYFYVSSFQEVFEWDPN